MPAPAVTDDAAVLSLRDRAYRRVELSHELRQPRLVPFERRGATWRLRFERPPVARLEYLLEVERRNGRAERIVDPGNPLRAPGPFGDKSVLEFPDYERPAWVGDETSETGEVRPLPLRSRRLRTTVDALLWSAAETGPREPLPLLFFHDGPEYARFSAVARLFDHLVAFGEVAPFRAALVPPPLDRSEMYSASPRYVRALADEWLPALAEAAPSRGRPVAVGASLGALSLLHAQWTAGVFGGLLLQSGSFFRRRYDSHEADFGRFARVARFVSTVAGRTPGPEPVPVMITCGTAEENLDNNRFLAAALDARGWWPRLVEHADAHNWISWRDVLHPHLADLMLRAVR